MLHHIRRTILDKLATAEQHRYAALKPDDLDGNVFNYHLKGLLNDNFVVKTEAGDYKLTTVGRDYIVHRHEDRTHAAHSIYLLAIRRGSKYLLRRRMVQPLLGYAGFVHGEPEAGVDITESARQRLADKAGITDARLSVAGSALISQYRDGEFESFSHAIIITGETEQDILTEQDATGANFWGDLEAVDKLLPSCHDIHEMLEHSQSWLDKTYNL